MERAGGAGVEVAIAEIRGRDRVVTDDETGADRDVRRAVDQRDALRRAAVDAVGEAARRRAGSGRGCRRGDVDRERLLGDGRTGCDRDGRVGVCLHDLLIWSHGVLAREVATGAWVTGDDG